MESFKYEGTPEQMAKVAEYLERKYGFTWWNDENGSALLVDCYDNTLFYTYLPEDYSYTEISPALELEIFGKTDKITGKPAGNTQTDEEWFKQPKNDMFLENAYDKPKNTIASVVTKMIEKSSAKIKSDGGSSDYYKLTIRTKQGEFQCEVGDVIRAMVGNDFDLGNVVKATRRIWCDSQGMGKEGIDMKYDAKKIAYFINEFIEAHK